MTDAPLPMADLDPNTLIVAGAIWMTLQRAEEITSVTIGEEPDGPGRGRLANQVDVRFSFMKSAYRLTIDRIPDD